MVRKRSNAIVVGGFYGPAHSREWWLGAVLSTAIPVIYAFTGGMRASIMTDSTQARARVRKLVFLPRGAMCCTQGSDVRQVRMRQAIARVESASVAVSAVTHAHVAGGPPFTRYVWRADRDRHRLPHRLDGRHHPARACQPGHFQPCRSCSLPHKPACCLAALQPDSHGAGLAWDMIPRAVQLANRWTCSSS